MDPRPFLPLLQALGTVGFTATFLFLMQEYAVRHGGSLLKNLGVRGWAIAIEVVTAAGLFSGVFAAVVAAPYNVPTDWTIILIYGSLASTLGVGLFFLAWRTLIEGLPPSPARVAQKG